jgi:hypothetical protein
MREGRLFELYEGNKRVANGVVTAVKIRGNPLAETKDN